MFEKELELIRQGPTDGERGELKILDPYFVLVDFDVIMILCDFPVLQFLQGWRHI
jgi:hypothetical protein